MRLHQSRLKILLYHLLMPHHLISALSSLPSFSRILPSLQSQEIYLNCASNRSMMSAQAKEEEEARRHLSLMAQPSAPWAPFKSSRIHWLLNIDGMIEKWIQIQSRRRLITSSHRSLSILQRWKSLLANSEITQVEVRVSQKMSTLQLLLITGRVKHQS